MGIKKRLILLLCAIGMCFQFIILSSVSAEGNKVIDNAEVLYHLDIITDSPEEFCAKEGITRAEMVRLMVRMSGMADTVLEVKDQVYFTDVEDDSEYADDINTALVLGIIHGNGDYTFSPDEYITYPAMVKMAVSLLGHEALAINAGGYPQGYLKIATDLKLGSSADLIKSDKVSGSVAAAFLYELLDAEIAQISNIGQNVEYTTKEGETLLTEKLKMEFVEGVVTGTEATGLFGKTTLSKGSVSIDGVPYIYEGETRELIGRKVEAYFAKEGTDNEFEIKYIKVSDDNEIVVIDADEIIDFSGFSYTYYDKNGKKEHETVSEGAAIIFNGCAVTDPEFDMTRLKPVEGMVTLINNNRGDSFNVLVVNSYYNLVVDVVNAYDLKIYDAYTASRNLDLKNGNREYEYEIYDQNGTRTGLSKLKKDNVLTVEKSDDNTFYIRISEKNVTGTVTRVSADEKAITIDDVQYSVSESFMNSGEPFFKAGDNGTFLLDIYGKVAGKKQVRDSEYRVGIVSRLILSEGVSFLPSIKIVSVLGEEENFEFAKTVEVDGEKIKNRDVESVEECEIISAIRKGIEGENPTLLEQKPDSQVIRYKLNDEKKIYAVDTSYVNEDKEEKESTLRRNLGYDKGKKLFYKETSMNLGGKELVASSTITFVVTTPMTGSVEDDYKITSDGYFSDNSYYNIESFCYTPDKIGADIIIVYRNYSSVGVEDSAGEFVIDKKGITLSNDDTAIEQVSGYYNKNYVSYGVKETAALDAPLEEGDLVRIAVNNKNEIIAAKHVYSAKDKVITEVNTDFDKNLRIISGYLYSNFENQIVVAQGNKQDNIEDTSTHNKFNLLSGAAIYIYDSNNTREPVRIGSETDFQSYLKFGSDCSKVIVRTKFGGVQTVYIIK